MGQEVKSREGNIWNRQGADFRQELCSAVNKEGFHPLLWTLP